MEGSRYTHSIRETVSLWVHRKGSTSVGCVLMLILLKRNRHVVSETYWLSPTGHTLPGPTAPTPANSRSPASPGTRRRPTHRTYTPDGRSWATSRTPTQRSTQRTRLGVAADRAQTSTPALTTRYTALRYTPRLPAVDAALTVDAAPAAPAARAASNPLPNERLARRPRARPHQRHRVSGTGAAVHVRSPRQWPCARRNNPAAHGPWRNT